MEHVEDENSLPRALLVQKALLCFRFLSCVLVRGELDKKRKTDLSKLW